MPVSVRRVRERMNFRQTRDDKGLILTITVIAYDDGMVKVDDDPTGPPRRNRADSAAWWLNATERVAMVMAEFQRQVTTRQQTLGKQ